MQNCLYLDLEVQTHAEEVGGFTPESTRRRKMAVAVTLNPATMTLQVYQEAEVHALVDALQEARFVIGYNLDAFDLIVLSAYEGVDVSGINTFDLMDAVTRAAGRRYSLSELVEGTLGSGAIMNGPDLVQDWKEGNTNKVIHACCNDVLCMWRIHQQGMENGCLKAAARRHIEVMWREFGAYGPAAN
jgi:DEAD/DEAH box helicase domain-containing protein